MRPPWFLESRVDAFLETFGDRVAEMSPDEFTRQKEGLIVKKLEHAKNLHEETSRFWAHIRSGYYDFLRRTSLPAFPLRHSTSVPWHAADGR